MKLPVEITREVEVDYGREIEEVISTLTPPPYTRLEHLYCLIRATATIYVRNHERICDMCYDQISQYERNRYVKTTGHNLCNYMGLLRGSICIKCGITMVLRRPAETCTECMSKCITLNPTENIQLIHGTIIDVEDIQ